jgi:hypothetical protein
MRNPTWFKQISRLVCRFRELRSSNRKSRVQSKIQNPKSKIQNLTPQPKTPESPDLLVERRSRQVCG